MTKETTEERVRREGLTALAQQAQAAQLVRPAPTSTPSIVPYPIDSKEYQAELDKAIQRRELFKESSSYNPQRADFAIQMLASLVNASRQNGTLPNADMMAAEAIKYADALIKALTEK